MKKFPKSEHKPKKMDPNNTKEFRVFAANKMFYSF